MTTFIPRRATTALALALSVLVGVLSADAVAWAQGASSPKLTVKFGWQLQADFPFQAAKASGAFQEVGLDAQYVQFPSGREMMAGLQSKSIDVAHFSGIVFNVALAQGLDLRAVWVYQDHARNEGLVARPNSGIEKLADLGGKRVAYTKGSAVHYTLFKALVQTGLTPDKVALKDLGPDKGYAAFLNGDVDAYWVWQPWRAKAQAEGGKLIVTDEQVGVSIPAIWAARTEWVAQNPEAARRLVLAAALTVERLKKDKTVGVKAVSKALGVSEEMAARIFEGDYIPTAEELLSENGRLSMTSPAGLAKALDDIGAFLHAQKIVRERPQPAKAIDPEPLRAAQKGRR